MPEKTLGDLPVEVQAAWELIFDACRCLREIREKECDEALVEDLKQVARKIYWWLGDAVFTPNPQEGVRRRLRETAKMHSSRISDLLDPKFSEGNFRGCLAEALSRAHRIVDELEDFARFMPPPGEAEAEAKTEED